MTRRLFFLDILRDVNDAEVFHAEPRSPTEPKNRDRNAYLVFEVKLCCHCQIEKGAKMRARLGETASREDGGRDAENHAVRSSN